jgi:hypothetical protein
MILPSLPHLALLIRAIAWPAVAVGALIGFRAPLRELITFLGQRVNKISVAGVSLDLATASELKSQALDADLRELDAGTKPHSGPFDLLAQFRDGGACDFIVIDLGSLPAPRWLTSRLYILALLLTRVGRLKCFVFVETAGQLRNRFIGTASPEDVRWALARHYPWLEQAYALAYAQLGSLQFDPAKGSLSEWCATALLQGFLSIVRNQGPPLIFPDPTRIPEVIDLGNGVSEYAKWIDGGRIERILGTDLEVASVTIPPGKSLDDTANSVIQQTGRFVAVVENDRTFRSLIDRSAILENLAKNYARQLN